MDSAKQELLRRLKETAKDNNGAISASEGEFSQGIICEEPPKKCFHPFRRLNGRREGLKRTATLPLGKAEIEKYFLTVDVAADEVDLLVYWLGQQNNHSLLSSLRFQQNASISIHSWEGCPTSQALGLVRYILKACDPPLERLNSNALGSL